MIMPRTASLPLGLALVAATALGAGPSRGQDPAGAAPSDSGLRFTALAVGGAHACGLTAEGAAYCWGGNAHGQLGDSSTTDRPAPVAVHGGLVFQALTAGERHTCGVDADGYPYCWGDNEFGQSGTGASGARSYPSRVQGRTRMKLMSAGARHTCATIVHWELEDRIFCWGNNAHGQLGNRELRNSAAPAPVFGTVRYTSLAAGSRHTCAVNAAGHVLCWGANERGQLGNGSVTNSNVPFPIRIGTRIRFSSVAVGEAHSCALTTAGEAVCWGDNADGQLGINKAGGREMMPERLDRSIRFVALTAAGNTTCGLRADGVAYCWGSNAAGQFGAPAPAGAPAPIPVLGSLRLTALRLGPRGACGLQEDGTALCWGGGNGVRRVPAAREASR